MPTITQSVVRIYDDQLKTTLITSVTTQGASTAITVDDLAEGSEYWATAQVTDDGGLTSNESSPYRFYTLPDVDWFSQPVATSSTISAQLEGVTDTVTISRYGLVYDTNSTFTNPTYYDEPQGGIQITGLSEHTTYYVRPYVIDEFNRRWINESLTVTLTTSYAVPTVTWSGTSTLGVTTWSQDVNITSSDTLTSVYVEYTPAGGSTQTLNLTATTGTQNVSLTGLNPNTSYDVVVKAVSASGMGTSTTQTFTTIAPVIAVNVDSLTLNNLNNQIAVSASAQANDPSAISITGFYLDLYDNNTHTGSAVETINGGSVSSMTGTLSHADPDDTYYVYGRVTWTVTGDQTVHTAWSAPYEVTTYALLSFGTIQTTNTTASIPYTVAGTALSDEIAYSYDNSVWTPIPVTTLSGGTLSVTGLTPSTSYYLRGRCQSTAGWQGYVTTTFSTTGVLPVVTIDSVSNITPSTAQVNLIIS